MNLLRCVVVSFLPAVLASLLPAQDCPPDGDDAKVVVPREFSISAREFYTLVFPFPYTSAGEPKQRANEALDKKLELLDSVISLSEAQRRKVRLAGRGDLKAVFDRIDELYHSRVQVPLTQAEQAAAREEMIALGFRLSDGPFGETSLFAKTVRGTFTAEQLTQYLATERALRLKSLESMLARGAGLPPNDSRKVAEAIVDKYSSSAAPEHYLQFVVLLQAVEVCEKTPALLEPAARVQLQNATNKSQQWEQQLRQMGIWPPQLVAKERE